MTLDTAAQIQSMVVARNYEDLMAQSSGGRARFDGQAKSKRRLLRRG